MQLTIERILASVDLDRRESARQSLLDLSAILDQKFEAAQKNAYGTESCTTTTTRSLLEQSTSKRQQSRIGRRPKHEQDRGTTHAVDHQQHEDEDDDRSFRSFDSDKWRKCLKRVTRRKASTPSSKHKQKESWDSLFPEGDDDYSARSSSAPIKILYLRPNKSSEELGNQQQREQQRDQQHHFSSQTSSFKIQS